MIATGDSVARNAFRVALANAALETPLPLAGTAGMPGMANTTQELDPSDILEVRDMAEAIARAEKIVNAPRSSARGLTDIFESLGRRATDDAVGPATPAPVGARPTPIPPRFLDMPSALPLPAAAVPATEDDAYFQPSGRMRSLADVTLDGYRPEPTLLLRARTRRRHFSWFIAAALLPLLALAVVAVLARVDLASASAAPKAPAVTAPAFTAAPAIPTPTATPLPTTATTATATATATVASPATPARAAATRITPVTPARQGAKTTSGVPVFDVNSLPSAPGSKPRTR